MRGRVVGGIILGGLLFGGELGLELVDALGAVGGVVFGFEGGEERVCVVGHGWVVICNECFRRCCCCCCWLSLFAAGEFGC